MLSNVLLVRWLKDNIQKFCIAGKLPSPKLHEIRWTENISRDLYFITSFVIQYSSIAAAWRRVRNISSWGKHLGVGSFKCPSAFHPPEKKLFEYFNFFTRQSKFGLLNYCRTYPLEGIFAKPHFLLVLPGELFLLLISPSSLLLWK